MSGHFKDFSGGGIRAAGPVGESGPTPSAPTEDVIPECSYRGSWFVLAEPQPDQEQDLTFCGAKSSNRVPAGHNNPRMGKTLCAGERDCRVRSFQPLGTPQPLPGGCVSLGPCRLKRAARGVWFSRRPLCGYGGFGGADCGPRAVGPLARWASAGKRHRPLRKLYEGVGGGVALPNKYVIPECLYRGSGFVAAEPGRDPPLCGGKREIKF